MESVAIEAGCRKDVNKIQGRVEHKPQNSTTNILDDEQITCDTPFRFFANIYPIFGKYVTGIFEQLFTFLELELSDSDQNCATTMPFLFKTFESSKLESNAMVSPIGRETLISTAEVLSEISIPIHLSMAIHPLIAFEHLSCREG